MTTSQPSNPSREQLTLFAVDSPVKTSHLQVNKPASRKALGLVSFTNSCESFAWFNPDTSSWKTSQRSLLTDWTPFLESWPRQGLMQNGHVFQRVLWEPAIKEIGGGSLPTPRANSAMSVNLRTQQGRLELQRNLETVMARLLPTLAGAMLRNDSIPTGAATYLNPSFVEEMMGFPVGWTDLKP
jgi:hypothetical protein